MASPPAPAAARGETTATPASAEAPGQATATPGSSPQPAGSPGERAKPPGSPLAGEQLGHDVATPASVPASAPRLDLSLPRARAPELPNRGQRGALNLLPPPPERKSKLADDIEKAAREDCRKAHADKGLLGAVFIARDAATDKGCKW